MNADELEKRIAELPETKVPAGWRQEILRATQRVRPEGIEQVAYKDSWWWKILWPSPWAWGGTAAVWAVIVILNSYALDGSGQSDLARVPLPSAALSEMAQSERIYLMKSLLDASSPDEPRPTIERRPGRRSEGRTEWLRS